MKIKLSSNNLSQYLLKAGILQKHDINLIKIHPQSSCGSNSLIVLRISLANEQQIFVKQDHHHFDNEIGNIINRELHFYIFCQSLLDLEDITSLILKMSYFDKSNSIIIHKTSSKYIDLQKFYKKSKIFSTALAKLIGTTLATLHRETSTSLSCHDFMNKIVKDKPYYQFSHPSHLLEKLAPETLIEELPPEGNRFIAFYQSSEILGKKVAELVANHNHYCLTHNNLELNNILIPWQDEKLSYEKNKKKIIKLINWEKCSWGDPAFDVGAAIANYLLLWLESLITHPAVKLEQSLQLATISLKDIQPSVVALTSSYISNFPKVLEEFPDFLIRVIQFAGLVLIYRIIAIIQSFKGFDNREICILQLAKSLLCQPEKSFPSVFGMTKVTFRDLMPLSKVNNKSSVK